MSFDRIIKLDKQLKEVNHELHKGSERIHNRKNMNGKDWDTRQQLVNDKRKILQEVKHNLGV